MEDKPYPWLSETEYKKACGQLRGQLRGVLKVFDMYGLGDYIPGTINECVELAIQFSQRMRGKDIPIKRSRE